MTAIALPHSQLHTVQNICGVAVRNTGCGRLSPHSVTVAISPAIRPIPPCHSPEQPEIQWPTHRRAQKYTQLLWLHPTLLDYRGFGAAQSNVLNSTRLSSTIEPDALDCPDTTRRILRACQCTASVMNTQVGHAGAQLTAGCSSDSVLHPSSSSYWRFSPLGVRTEYSERVSSVRLSCTVVASKEMLLGCDVLYEIVRNGFGRVVPSRMVSNAS